MSKSHSPKDAWAWHDVHYTCSTGYPLSLRPAFAGEMEALELDINSRTNDKQILYIILRGNNETMTLEKIPVWLEPVEFWRCEDVAALIRTIEGLSAHGATDIDVSEAQLYFGKDGGNA